MVFSFDVYIKYANSTDRDIIKGFFPLSSDPKVVSRLHKQPKETQLDDATNVIIGHVRYKTLANLNSARSDLKSLNGTWSRSSSGSYLQGHECHNDDNSAGCTVILFKDEIA